MHQTKPTKHKNGWYALTGIFFLIWIGGFFAAHLLLPDNSFSPMENRVLRELPPFSAHALLEGRFTSDFETYVSDQFPLRDQLVELNTAAEFLSGRRERNGVYYGEDVLIQQFSGLNDKRLTANAGAVAALQQRLDIPVYGALIPSAADIWQNKLPAGAPNINQQTAINRAYTIIGDGCANVYGALHAHKSEYVYYHTDHHWTSLGAYYGYAACMEAMGIAPVPLERYQKSNVSTGFYGTLHSSAPLWRVLPDTIDTYVPEEGIAVTVFDGTNILETELYCEERLNDKNQYTLFLGGNQPKIILRTPHWEAPRLLVLRDSYMDSMVPFLTAHFSQIHLLDLRYYKQSLTEYAAQNGIDAVLVCYSLKNFQEDDNLPFVLALS